MMVQYLIGTEVVEGERNRGRVGLRVRKAPKDMGKVWSVPATKDQLFCHSYCLNREIDG